MIGADMPVTTTLTVRISSKTKDRLGRLARRTSRTRSFLAGRAIADFVEREFEIVEGIRQGLEDIEAGRTIPHDKAMRRVRATIARAARKKAKA
jgi:predicted transcriptional regulator